MIWLDKIRSWWRQPDVVGDSPGSRNSAAAGAAARAAHSRPRVRQPVAPEEMSHSSQQAISGYGSNPYDTYTWELHTDADEERRLKRTTDVNRKSSTGDPNNPYDTGSFKGGWS